MLNHTNRVVLATGAGSGIGLSIADAFANSGASVGVLDFNKENVNSTVEELRIRGYWVHGCQADVLDYDMVRDAARGWGGRNPVRIS